VSGFAFGLVWFGFGLVLVWFGFGFGLVWFWFWFGAGLAQGWCRVGLVPRGRGDIFLTLVLDVPAPDSRQKSGISGVSWPYTILCVEELASSKVLGHVLGWGVALVSTTPHAFELCNNVVCRCI